MKWKKYMYDTPSIPECVGITISSNDSLLFLMVSIACFIAALGRLKYGTCLQSIALKGFANRCERLL